MLISVITGFGIAAANAVSALIVYKYALKKEITKFIKVVFLSMTIRYFLTVLMVWLCLKIFNLNALAFSLTLLIATFVLIMAEILYLINSPNLLNLRTRMFKKD